MRWHGRRVQVYAYTRPTDMRKGFDGLCALVTQGLHRDPLFCGGARSVADSDRGACSLDDGNDRVPEHATYLQAFEDAKDGVFRLEARRRTGGDTRQFETPPHHRGVRFGVPMRRTDIGMTQPGLDRYYVRTGLEQAHR